MLSPILAGQHHVEHDEIEALALEQRIHLDGRTNQHRSEAVVLQHLGQHASDIGIVLDAEDACVGDGESHEVIFQDLHHGILEASAPNAQRANIAFC
ncbi:hypothetical protein ABIF00_006623 [Bradyrhizobium elkanii]